MSPSGARTVWTTRDLLAWMQEAFARTGVDSPRICAEQLLAHVLGCERLRLYMDADRPTSEPERARLRELVGRALKHEPTQYLVGEAWFHSLPFHVDRRVLIPRPSTETAVDLVVRHIDLEPGFETGPIGEIGVGSGCVVVSLLKRFPKARAIGTDISADALAVARSNAERHGVEDRLDLVEGDLLTPLAEHPSGRRLVALVSNPPYIPDDEWERVEPNVKEHEPERALRGGADGLDFVRPLLEAGHAYLRPGGLLVVEIAASRAAEALAIAQANAALARQRIEHDAEGFERFVVAERAS
jgi:release factor glutamine methyltransferase